MAKDLSELLKAAVNKIFEAYVLAPLLTLLAPAALWTFAKDFVTSDRIVPGWAFLFIAALVGLLLASGWFHAARWYKDRTRLRRNLLIVAHGGVTRPSWTDGPDGRVYARGIFDITNIGRFDVTIPRTTLQIFYWQYGVIPTWRTLSGESPRFILQAGATARDNHLVWGTPTVIKHKYFRACVGLVDSFGVHSWSTWETWPRT